MLFIIDSLNDNEIIDGTSNSANKNKSPKKKTSGYHYIRYLHINNNRLKHAKSRSVDLPTTPASAASSAVSLVCQSSDDSSSVCQSVIGRHRQLALTRGQPEGTSQGTLHEVTKRHSIAVMPRDHSASRMPKKRRESSQSRVSISSNERVLVDIKFPEHDPEECILKTPEKSPGIKRKSREIKQRKSVQKHSDNEPIYEKVKGSSFDTSRATSVYDNALYMSMKDLATPNDKTDSQVIDLYQDGDSIYSTPKVRISPDPNGTPTDMSENIYENMLYLPMSDVNRSAQRGLRPMQHRPLPIPPNNKENCNICQLHQHCDKETEKTIARNVRHNHYKSMSIYCQPNESNSSLMGTLTDVITKTPVRNKADANTQTKFNYQCPSISNRPPLPPPPSPCNNVTDVTNHDLLMTDGIDSLFTTTCKISRTGIIRQSKIRQNMRTESSIDEDDQDDISFNRSFSGDTSDCYSNSGQVNPYLSDNPDSGMSEGIATPILSPVYGLTCTESTGSLHNTGSPSSPFSDSLLGDPCTPLTLNDLQANKTLVNAAQALEKDYFLRSFQTTMCENISHDITDPRFLSAILTEKQIKERTLHNIYHNNLHDDSDVANNSTYLDASKIQNPRGNELSRMVHSTVGRNLFSEFNDISAITTYNKSINREKTGKLERRHSISSSQKLFDRVSKLSKGSNTTLWETMGDSFCSESLPLRKSFSLDSFYFSSDVPLNISDAEILRNTSDRQFKVIKDKKICSDGCSKQTKGLEQCIPDVNACRRTGISFGQSVEGDHKEEVAKVGVASASCTPGNQACTSQWSEQSSRDHLSHRTPGNMTPKLPELRQQRQATHMTAACNGSVPVLVAAREDVPIASCVQPLNLNSVATTHRRVAHKFESTNKLSDKQLQRQEESSYRILRLFQECPLDCIVESEDEDWDCTEWSMQATIDENSTRDPAVLEISDSVNSLDVSVECKVNCLKYSDIVVSPKVLAELKNISDEKMLAKFRQSFRRKDKNKVEQKVSSIFMFVENPMYLSPEEKKEAKVISSMCNNNHNWFVNNPTYSSPEVLKTKVRTYTRSYADNFQCEKENIKNLRLADGGIKTPTTATANFRYLQCNPCYDSAEKTKLFRCPTVSYRKDTSYLEPINGNIFDNKLSQTKPADNQADVNNGNASFIDHEYCTIAGDEESDSWITQSSGSQQPGSPSMNRSFFELQQYTTQQYLTEYRKRNVLSKESVTPSRMWREQQTSTNITTRSTTQVYGNVPLCNESAALSTSAAAPLPQTPRSLRKLNKLRDQVSH